MGIFQCLYQGDSCSLIRVRRRWPERLLKTRSARSRFKTEDFKGLHLILELAEGCFAPRRRWSILLSGSEEVGQHLQDGGPDFCHFAFGFHSIYL